MEQAHCSLLSLYHPHTLIWINDKHGRVIFSYSWRGTIAQYAFLFKNQPFLYHLWINLYACGVVKYGIWRWTIQEQTLRTGLLRKHIIKVRFCFKWDWCSTPILTKLTSGSVFEWKATLLYAHKSSDPLTLSIKLWCVCCWVFAYVFLAASSIQQVWQEVGESERKKKTESLGTR